MAARATGGGDRGSGERKVSRGRRRRDERHRTTESPEIAIAKDEARRRERRGRREALWRKFRSEEEGGTTARGHAATVGKGNMRERE